MISPKRSQSAAGASLVEVLVAVACSILIAGIAILIYTSSLDLFRANSAINYSHENARGIIDRLEKEIQSAISIPALVRADRNIIDTTGPAPGVAFLRQSGTVRQVTATALLGATIVQLNNGASVKVGQRLLIPAYDIEGDIIGVNGNALTLAAPLPTDVMTTLDGVTRNVIAIVTDLVTYVVVDANAGTPRPAAYELREYQNAATNDYNLIATGFTEPQPFSLPYNAVPGATPTS